MRTSHISGLIAAVLIFVSITACGIQFRSPSDETELFKSIDLSGDLQPGAELTVTIFLTRSYPVPVIIACFYEMPARLTKDQQNVAFHERATKIGETLLQPLPAANRSEDLILETVTFKFAVADPGDFFLACLTPAAPENRLDISFTTVAGISN